MHEGWLTLKSYFNDFGYMVYYLDNEGSEIPIENECDFQKALRMGKMDKQRLKLIVYSKEPAADNDTLTKSQCKSSDTAPLDITFQTLTVEEVSDSEEKCQCQCRCNGKIPPEWFLRYMKKFKKELLQELKSNSGCNVPNVRGTKEVLKKETIDFFCSKIKAASVAAATQTKWKKKRSEKVLGELVDQRDTKMAKKSEKLSPTKLVRLEKLDNKTKVLMEEKRRLLEKKRHLKQRLEKNNGIMDLEKPEKSATFDKNKMCLFLPPSAEFVVTLNFTNDGTLRWEAPRIECYDFNGLYPKESTIYLPKLGPMESGFTTLRGKVSQSGGVHYFKCRLFDDQKKISPEFTCWAKVETTESVNKIPNAIISCKDSYKSEGALMDFERNEFAATQKKIDENINEIERRLKDIDLFRPLTSSEDIMGSNAVNLRMPEGPQDNGCDSLQNTEEKKMNWKEELEQEGVHFGLNCLSLTTPGSNDEKQEDKNGRVENVDNSQKNVDCDSNYDSEPSLILSPEDDENFVMIPLESGSPSLAEYEDEDKKHMKTFEKSIPNASEAKADLFEQKPSESFKVEIIENSKETLNISDKCQRLRSYLKDRWPLHEVSKTSAKKIKFNSAEYRFTTDDLTQPIVIQIPESSSKFTFTGVKGEEESRRKRPEEETIKRKEDQSKKENGFEDYTIPATDGSRNVIYAVDSNGHCFPVGKRSEDWDHWGILRHNSNGSFRTETEHLHRSERRNKSFSEDPDVNAPPNLLINRAANVASRAFNTAKNVINNFHSTFVTEGVKKKTETGKPENRPKVSSSAMCILVEMGFTDVELNRYLLSKYRNDVIRVVQELSL